MTGHTATVSALAVSPDGALLASSSEDDTVRTWDIASHRLVTLVQDMSGVQSLAFSQDSKFLACGAVSGRLVDLSTGKVLVKLTGQYDSILTIAFSPTHQIMACGAMDKTIRLWGP